MYNGEWGSWEIDRTLPYSGIPRNTCGKTNVDMALSKRDKEYSELPLLKVAVI